MNVLYENFPSKSFQFICRTCLMSTEQYSINEVSWEGIFLKEVMSTYTTLQVEDNDKLPKNMCKSCIKNMYQTYNFLNKCKKSEDILKYVLRKETVVDATKLDNDIIIETMSNAAENEENGKDVFSYKMSLEDNTGLEVGDSDKVEEVKSEHQENIDYPNTNNKITSTVQLIKKEIVEKTQLVINYQITKPQGRQNVKGPPYTCLDCNASFKIYGELKTHKIQAKHRNGKYVCPYCQRRDHDYGRYVEHVRTHTGEKPNECPTCGRKFNGLQDLKRHMALHMDVRPYLCRFCKKGFVRRQYLVEHEKKHTGEKVQCQFCGKNFCSQSTLIYHERTHKGLPGRARNRLPEAMNFLCNFCGKTLSSKLTLNAHILLHGSKNYSCETCGKSYFTEVSLNEHIKSAHKDVRYACDICDKVYKQKSGLANHKLSHNGQNFPCDACNKQFSFKSSLLKHKRYHTGDTKYQCKECFKICITRRTLDGHMRLHTGEKPFVCVFCGKFFTFKANMLAHKKIHTDDKKHLCNVCGKRFLFRRGLKKHAAIHAKENEVS